MHDDEMSILLFAREYRASRLLYGFKQDDACNGLTLRCGGICPRRQWANMDILFRKGYPMPELRKLQVATATTVSAKDIIILGCVGGTIKVFPIQTGQPTRAFATFLPCLHKLYFEKQGGNIFQ